MISLDDESPIYNAENFGCGRIVIGDARGTFDLAADNRGSSSST